MLNCLQLRTFSASLHKSEMEERDRERERGDAGHVVVGSALLLVLFAFYASPVTPHTPRPNSLLFGVTVPIKLFALV